MSACSTASASNSRRPTQPVRQRDKAPGRRGSGLRSAELSAQSRRDSPVCRAKHRFCVRSPSNGTRDRSCPGVRRPGAVLSGGLRPAAHPRARRRRAGAQRGALCPRHPRRQRRHLGLGPHRRRGVLLAPVARDPRSSSASGRPAVGHLVRSRPPLLRGADAGHSLPADREPRHGRHLRHGGPRALASATRCA